jgi:hypothetical protein
MDDRLRICLWMVGSGGFGSVLGSFFGALAAGLLCAWSGHAAGTRLARQVVDNFLQSGAHQPSPVRRAALIGAADGFFFLGILGLIAGALLGASGWSSERLVAMVWPLALDGLFLVGGAILFGLLAYTLTHHGPALLYITAGGLVGSFLAGRLLGWDNSPIGVVPGLCIGLFLCRAVRRYSPTFHAPRVGATLPPSRSDGSIDITGPPPLRPGSDAIRKSDAEDESDAPA